VPFRHSAGAIACALAVLTLFSAFDPALAAAAGATGPVSSSETIFVVQIGLLLLVGRIMGEAAQRIGQPAVIGQLIGGLLLGPSVFGALWPSAQHTLFPDSGTQKRRAVEIGLALARADDAQVTALYVTRSNANGGRKGVQAKRRNELAVLEDISTLADRYDVRLRSTTRGNVAPDEAILQEAKRGYDLIVLGVSRRPGDTLFFGNTATAIFDRSETSNLFVAS
jgi:nucleotide-binding universal stress UspA family protein